jgi:MFS family permease
MSTFVVGLLSGAQFAASLVSRFWSGHFADQRGGKKAMSVGLLVASCAGVLYLVSLSLLSQPGISIAVLLGGRAVT